MLARLPGWIRCWRTPEPGFFRLGTRADRRIAAPSPVRTCWSPVSLRFAHASTLAGEKKDSGNAPSASLAQEDPEKPAAVFLPKKQYKQRRWTVGQVRAILEKRSEGLAAKDIALSLGNISRPQVTSLLNSYAMEHLHYSLRFDDTVYLCDVRSLRGDRKLPWSSAEKALVARSREKGFTSREIGRLLAGRSLLEIAYHISKTQGLPPKRPPTKEWSADDERRLLAAAKEGLTPVEIKPIFPGRTSYGIEKRLKYLGHLKPKYPNWTVEEDRIALDGRTLGLSHSQIADKLPGRTIRSVKERLFSIRRLTLSPADPRHYSKEEEKLLLQGVKKGLTVAQIVKTLPGRTPNSIYRKKKRLESEERRDRNVRFWTADEDRIVLEGRGEGLTYEQLEERLPGRTTKGIMARVYLGRVKMRMAELTSNSKGDYRRWNEISIVGR